MSEPTVAEAAGSRWLRGPLQPFQHGQYRMLVGSLTASMFGEGLWLMAMVWQVIALGGKAGELSLVTTGTAVGMVVTVLLGGAIADRVPQRRILLTTELILASAAVLGAVLAMSGVIEVWHLALIALVRGIGSGFYFPAYSAMLPAIVPADNLMAANGVENMLRPVIMQAAGPAIASLMVAAHSPGLALSVGALSQVVATVFLVLMRPVALRAEREQDGQDGGQARHPVVSMLADIREGFVYMLKTPWLLATLLFASLMILVIMGPMEVLIPFAVKDGAGGGPREHAIVMAAFGISGALSSLVMASRRMPRRYLTVMNLTWGVACLPFVLIGVAGNVWVIVLAAFALGALFNAPMVIWGTLLQRRVPPALLGRVSSLDFFVSLVFMPISMALAGPVSSVLGLNATFIIAGLIPLPIAILAIVLARMPADELAHPLDQQATDDEPADETPLEDAPALPAENAR
ncbi:MFS transporter [Spongiactinospora sp. TRM90649]|uniref:MFS transporter n=1 Tax=Spongiactinospora sp. TRM90649 TaxID=3031114 RepID=UPI0023F6EBEE|nr:MFS transporter [Spongiactinospora sp. TRM90649]MDF5751139.1 MFS transporter [Spongiactinospora sp. TRM90649]